MNDAGDTLVQRDRVATGTGRGLTFGDFRPIARGGFGDRQNAYCHAMGYFDGALYVGTTRNSMALLKLFPPIDAPTMDPWPVNAPPRVQDLDMHGHIWRWSHHTQEWKQVLRSPAIIGKNGEEVPRDLGYRGMAVFQGRSDPTPALYVSTMSTVLRGTAAHILRSYDGESFEPVSEPGLGHPEISTFRSLVAFDGHLYAPPVGEGVNFNSSRRSVIMRSADPDVGAWEHACESGFGDPTNNGIFEIAEFNGHLYAGTFNNYQGYQVWKTPANGGGPCQWTKVLERGAHRGPLNQIAMSLCAFDGALYVGSAIQNGGYDRYNLVGPASGEIVRVYPDDSWELLVGMPRQTPEGLKKPLSGQGPGFDNIFAGYIWRMVVHDGWLYVTTLDWSVFLHYAKSASPTAQRLLDQYGVDRLVDTGGGFDLWRTKDGVNWVPVSLDGMGNPYNYGGRTLVSTPEGLYIGTANPFGPEVPARLASSWVYVENPDGGTEVWFGRKAQGSDVQCGAGDGEAPSAEGPAVEVASDEEPALLAVTGGAGFIGRNLVARLLRDGYRVRVLDLPGTAERLPASDRLEVIESDLEDPDALARAVAGADIVYHLAGRLPGSCPKAELRRTNVNGTHNLLRACAEHGGITRFVLASSNAVYEGQFRPDNWPIGETAAKRSDGGNDLADYGVSKIAAENLVRRFARECGFEFAILRFPACYGTENTTIEQLIEYIDYDESVQRDVPEVFPGQGLHVDDAVEGLVRAAFMTEAANDVFNIAAGESVSRADMAEMVRRQGGTPTSDDFIPDRTRVWRRYQRAYDIRKAHRRLNFVPSVSFQEALSRIVERTAGES